MSLIWFDQTRTDTYTINGNTDFEQQIITFLGVLIEELVKSLSDKKYRIEHMGWRRRSCGSNEFCGSENCFLHLCSGNR